jgi:hypothetical protein
MGASAQTIAAERHLLETVLRRPVILKPMPIKTAPFNGGTVRKANAKRLSRISTSRL